MLTAGEKNVDERPSRCDDSRLSYYRNAVTLPRPCASNYATVMLFGGRRCSVSARADPLCRLTGICNGEGLNLVGPVLIG